MKKLLQAFYLILIICLTIPIQAFAAPSFSAVANVSTITPGGTFSVSINGIECVGMVHISVSNGTSSESAVWVENNSVPVTITAGSSGSVTVTATPEVGMSDMAANEINPGIASASVTIVEPVAEPTPTPAPEPTPTPIVPDDTNDRWEFEEENEGLPESTDEEEKEDPKKRPEHFTITIDEVEYTIVETLKGENAPVGFTIGKTTYDGWEIPAFISNDKKVTLLSLKNNDTEKTSLFIYNEAEGSFLQETNISLEEYLEYIQLSSKAPESEKNANYIWVPIIIAVIEGLIIGVGSYYYLTILRPKKEHQQKTIEK